LGDHLIPLDIESLIDTIKAHGRHPQGLDKRSIGIIMKIEERFEKEVHLIFNKEIQPIMINDLLLSPENPFFKAKVLKLTEPYTGDLMFLKDDQPVNFEELKMRGQFPCKIIIFKARVWAIRCNTVTIPVKLIPERNLNFNL
jgi:hypothetical protein